MEDVLKMDLFFVVTTFAVVVITALLALVLVYVLRILRHLERISEDVAEESAEVRADVAKLRKKLHDEGLQMAPVASFLKSLLQRFFRRKRAK